MQKSIETKKTKKIVMTGSASSIVGQVPKSDEGYDDALEWADFDKITKPNERAKIVAERQSWAKISKS